MNPSVTNVSNPSRISEFIGGAKTTFPLLLGVFPSGMLYGVLALQAGLSIFTAQGMSAVVFAGSSQFLILQLVISGTPLFVIVLTAFVINLRHALYSASIAPYLKPLSLFWKIFLGYLLTDEAYSVGITRYMQDDKALNKSWYIFGSGLTLWVCWQIGTGCGILFGQQISPSLSLDFALPLTFIALVVPMIKDRAGLTAALTGGIVSSLSFGLPYKLGILLAAFIGIVSGLWSERK
jgi:4-azaleucine resistance transporter AzlC